MKAMEKNREMVPVITLDGPSGTGKGTLCHRLAEHLGWHALDSGVLYRALAYFAEQHQIPNDDISQLVTVATTLPLKFTHHQIFLANESVAMSLRTEACGAKASSLATIPEIREALLQRQRAFAVFPGLVTDGRDMGTVVFPNADLKIYLDASIEERSRRRYLQLKDSGKNVSLAQVVSELTTRDKRDTQRTYAPLKPADDAYIIDTTDLTVDKVFERLLTLVVEQGLMGEK